MGMAASQVEGKKGEQLVVALKGLEFQTVQMRDNNNQENKTT
ncbi:hypothetical protein [Paenibacillus sp. Leaf72]|nr:hypothetical protein [Paenibacillus sp. Leaf72]